MEIAKVGVEWAKAEVVSSIIFILFGVLFLLATFGFWQYGKTEIARAFIIPTLIAGGLLLAAGIGFLVGNRAKVANFEAEYKADPTAFVQTELARTKQTKDTYQNVAMKVFPGIIAVAALLLIFVERPIWRATFITVIAFLLVMVWIDSNALARISKYHQELTEVDG